MIPTHRVIYTALGPFPTPLVWECVARDEDDARAQWGTRPMFRILRVEVIAW